jgi:hypothetical protein
MVNDDEIESIMQQKLEKILEENMQQFIEQIATWFAHQIMYETKHSVEYYSDPSWDSSGTVLDTNKSFSIDEYLTLADFVENEYTGNTTVSYVSGCGLFHDRYEKELQQICWDWVSSFVPMATDELIRESDEFLEWLKEAFKENKEYTDFKTLSEFDPNHEQATKIAVDVLMGTEVAGWAYIHHEGECIERVKKMNASLLYKMGFEKAKKQHENDLKEQEMYQQQLEQAKERANELFSKIQKLYQIRYGNSFPKNQNIDKPFFDR